MMVVAVFDNPGDAVSAIEDLRKNGFERKNIGLVAQDIRSESERVLAGTRKGLAIGTLAGTLLAVSAIVIPGVGPAFVAGPVGVLLAGASVGGLAGGLIGALKSAGVSEKEAHAYTEGVRRGGILVTVNAASEELAARAADIMKRHSGVARFDQTTAIPGNTPR
jgi:hypothetical protein